MIINAQDLILGRLASFAAKRALLGEDVQIINCEKAVITGSRENVFAKLKARQKPGDAYHAPTIYRMPDMFVRRVIRGMLPWKKTRGRLAHKKIFCHIGIPESFKNKEAITLDNANINKLKNLRYVYIKEVSKYLGKEIKWVILQ